VEYAQQNESNKLHRIQNLEMGVSLKDWLF